MKPTISIIVPALNEEAQIAQAVEEAIRSVTDLFSDYELLLFNDGSTDQTGPIMDRLAAANPRIRVTHNPHPQNLGAVFKKGIAMARYEYLMLIPGDNENPGRALRIPLEAVGQADLVIPYTANQHVRPWVRQVTSQAYTNLMNLLFRLHLKYYNGTVVHRTDRLRTIEIKTNSFSFQTEALIKLLRAGASYVEVGIEIQPFAQRKSRAFRWNNTRDVGKSILSLLHEVYCKPANRPAFQNRETISSKNQTP